MTTELQTIVESMQEKKAEEVTVLDLKSLTSMTDYFILCSADSEPQLKAIYKNVEDRLKGLGFRPDHVEGRSDTGWVLMDYDDFVVHIMLPEKRTYYDLERLWGDAPRWSAPDTKPVMQAAR